MDGLPIWFMGLDLEIMRPFAVLFRSFREQLDSIEMPSGFPVRIVITSDAGLRAAIGRGIRCSVRPAPRIDQHAPP